jgi:hypothetical protein
VPLTHARRRHMTFQEIITVIVKVQTMGHYAATFRPVAAWVQTSKWFKFQGARRRLVAAEQPRAGSVLDPVCPETAGKVLRDLTSRTMTSEPDEDFDGHESTSARNRTRRSPMLTHETSTVSGASVMGMTIWVRQGQSHLPADIPGITTALGQRGRLQPKGRLHQQPAGDFTVEARAGEDDETPPTYALPKAAWPRQDR